MYLFPPSFYSIIFQKIPLIFLLFFFFLRTFLPLTHSPFFFPFLLATSSSPRSLTQPTLCPVPRAVAPRPPAGPPQSQASFLYKLALGGWKCLGPYRMKRGTECRGTELEGTSEGSLLILGSADQGEEISPFHSPTPHTSATTALPPDPLPPLLLVSASKPHSALLPSYGSSALCICFWETPMGHSLCHNPLGHCWHRGWGPCLLLRASGIQVGTETHIHRLLIRTSGLGGDQFPPSFP